MLGSLRKDVLGDARQKEVRVSYLLTPSVS